jgi:hypothetical protein
MAINIDDKENFLLMGLSFGGILFKELAKIKKPKKTTIV